MPHPDQSVPPTQYVATVKECPDTGELYFEIPSALLEKLGWKEGDDLDIQAEGQALVVRKIS